jgi:hypothetical protein
VSKRLEMMRKKTSLSKTGEEFAMLKRKRRKKKKMMMMMSLGAIAIEGEVPS